MPKLAQIILVASLACSLMHCADASEICGSLRFDLATVSSLLARDPQASDVADAIFSHETELDALESALAENKCLEGSILIIGGEHGDKCSMLGDKKARLEQNLTALEGKQLALKQEASAREAEKRDKIARALEENGCSHLAPLVGTPGEDEAPLVGDGASEKLTVPDASPFENDIEGGRESEIAQNGNFQTLCVRTCDGGFFPISSHASPIDFRRDAQTCSRMCPGLETELYYHGLEQESADMRSTATGKPYSSMSTAYRFKKSTPGNEHCSCDFSTYYKEMSTISAIRSLKLAPTENAGSIRVLKPAVKKADAQTKKLVRAEREYIPDRQIRRVGPAFLPDEHNENTALIADK